MTRSIENSKYSAWLVGYYDDWIGTQCIADDSNVHDTKHNHANTHAGNPCNGEAPLNPLYRFSTIERQEALSFASGSGALSEALPVRSWMGDFSLNNQFSILHNQGIHDYITKDTNRLLGGCFYEGKAIPRAPQTFFHQNRINLGRLTSSTYNDGDLENATTITNGVGFMWINNARSTNGKYWIPADNDGSYIRKSTKDVSATETGYLSNTIKHSEAGSHLSYTILTAGRNERNAYLTGMFQWQAMHQDAGAVDKRDAVGQEITSLGGKPFMVFDIKNYARNRADFAGAEIPIIAYDGTLNATGDEDVFHIRMCEQSLFGGRFGGGATITGATLNQTYAPKLLLNIGYLHSDATYSSAGINATNPAITVMIDRYAMDITDAFANYSHLATGLSDNAGVVPKNLEYHFCLNKIGTLSGTTKEDKMNNLWYDIDVKCNFTTQKYQVYVNGVAYGALTAFQSKPGGGAWSATDFYGWSLVQARVSHTGLSSESFVGTEGCYWNHIVMIDRVAFGKYVTHPLTGETPLLNKVSTIMTSNSLSSMRVDIYDDSDVLNLYPLISGVANSDYHFLLFRNGQDRPILNGILNNISIKQQMKQQTKVIELAISDPAKLLDKTLPVFDLGQTTLTSDLDVAAGLRGGAESLQDALYFGTAKLLVRDDNIGGDSNSNASLSFMPTQDQRTCLDSAHPIQLYNNEETIGPNYPEYQWLGKKAKVIHPLKHNPGSGMVISSSVTAVAIDANDGTVVWDLSGSQAPEGLQTGDTINIFGSVVSDCTNQAVTQHSGQQAADVAANNFCITKAPPGFNATSDAYIRWQHGTAEKVCIRLTSGSYSQTPSYTQATHVVVKRTDTALSQHDNTPYKILNSGYGSGADAYNFYIWIDADWTSFTGKATTFVGNATPIGCTSTSNQSRVYWSNGYVDLHTADASKSTVTTFNNVAPWSTPSVKNRAAQAVWLRDLPKSLWFQKMFGRIAETPDATGTLQTPYPVNTYTGSGFHTTGVLTTIDYNDVSADIRTGGGVAELVHPNGEVDSFCFGNVSNASGKAQLNDCKFITHNYQTNFTMGGTAPTINIRTISDDYKHIWVLWADMRNDGTADADGGERDTKFGLLYPTPDNYSVSLQYTDQVDIEGNAVDFVDLKVGYDCDIWELSSKQEPYSEDAWSTLGSNSHFEPSFHNWDRKAGAFLVFDFSKFFNLNTEANGGKCNQIAGRRKTLGDLVIDTEGHPALIDDYWQEVIASPKNLGLARTDITNHPNWYRFFSAGSNLAPNVGTSNTNAGSTTLKLDDTSEFPSEGIGMIELERDSTQGGTKERNLLFFLWFGNNTSTNTLSDVTSFDLDETTLTQDQIQTQMFQRLLGFTNSAAGVTASGLNQKLIYNDSINNITTGYDKIVAYSSLSAPFALRFMMKLNGYVESKDNGNWYIHDALRSMMTLANTHHPLSLFRLPVTFSKVNIPITRRMTTTQTTVSIASRHYRVSSGSVLDWDNFGGVVDMRGKSLLQAVVEITEKTRVGEQGSSTIFTYTTGKDGKLDIRPAYSSGFVFNRNNLSLSNISGSPTVSISNVRVFYNNGASFVDFPAGISGTESKWKFVDVPTVRSDKEASQIAKKTYEQSKESNIKIEAEFVTQATETDKMLYNARFGYIADPAFRTSSPVLKGAQTWTSWYNGAHYSGIQNRLDGNLTWNGYGTANVYNKRSYGKEVTNYSSDPQNHFGGACIFPTGDVAPEQNYGWIGDKSVTNAVEIVHIPKGMPKVSDAHGHELRVSIQLADYYEVSDGLDIEDMEFFLTLADVDPTFTAGATTVGSAVSNTFQPITIAENYPDVKHLQFKHSGFHEIEIPAGYWSGATGNERIVVSIDCEYLRACLRHRMGSAIGSPKWGNAVQIPGAPSIGTVDSGSCFPMGARTQPNIPVGQDAPWYHAPRIIIVDDLNFYPSTKVTFEDASLGITSATPFSINQVKWNANERTHDSVRLTLEKDESKGLGGLASYILPEINKGRTPGTIPTKPTPPPRTGGGGGGGGDSGYRPTIPPQVGPVGTPYTNPYQTQEVGNTPIGNNPEGIRNQPGAGVDAGTTTISGQLLSQANVGINNTTADLIKRATGNMDFHGQFGNKDGEFSILGQKKKGAPAQTTRELDGIDCVWDKNRGAVFSSEGAVFPGITSEDGSAVGQVHTHSLSATVPSDVIGKKIVLEGRISMSGMAGGTANGASLLVKLECKETGSSVSKLVPIYASTNEDENAFINMTLLSCELDGANVEGNTIKATIKRQATTGYDTAGYNSVVMNNLKMKFVRSAVSGRSDSYRFLGLKNGGVRGN